MKVKVKKEKGKRRGFSLAPASQGGESGVGGTG